MEEKLLEIFRSVFNETDPSEITLETEFKELEQYSSLTQMTLIEEIQSELNVTLKLMPMVKAETISYVLDAIQKKG